MIEEIKSYISNNKSYVVAGCVVFGLLIFLLFIGFYYKHTEPYRSSNVATCAVDNPDTVKYYTNNYPKPDDSDLLPTLANASQPQPTLDNSHYTNYTLL